MSTKTSVLKSRATTASRARVGFDLSYRDGAEGFIKFCEENIRISITPVGSFAPKWMYLGELPNDKHPITGRSYKSFWERHKEIVRECLKMKDGIFVYRRIILCWMRGEGKSFLLCLIIIWKWMNFPKQTLMLCANSKDQSVLVHYKEIVGILNNSPKLLKIIGGKNIQQKEIRLRDSKGNVVSTIASVTTFSGLMSNINGYTFSEFFELKNHKFFEDIDTSLRNITNAFGMIDTTVSGKNHPLFHIYQKVNSGEDTATYFSYRCSPNGDYRDFWHPNMTQEQLESFKVVHYVGKGFDRLFKNIWEAGEDKVFSKAEVESIYYLGAYGNLNNHVEVLTAVERLQKIRENDRKLTEESGLDGERYDLIYSSQKQIQEINQILWPADKEYKLQTENRYPRYCSIEELEHLGDLYDTDWCVLTGMDRAAPIEGKRTNARTIAVAVAKGLPQSRTRPEIGTLEVPKYLYVLLALDFLESSSLESMKKFLRDIDMEYGGINSYCSEPWGTWDLSEICEELNIKFDLVHPSQSKQLALFTELYMVVSDGRFKSARLAIPGSRANDILEEELLEFDHDPDKKWFGSTEKKKKHGIQDDSVYALAHALYGGRFFSVDDFEQRSGMEFLGSFYEDKRLIGQY